MGGDAGAGQTGRAREVRGEGADHREEAGREHGPAAVAGHAGLGVPPGGGRDESVYDALTAGADGFLLKDTDPAEILRAVHLVAAGSAMLHPSAARRLIDRHHRAGGPQAGAARARLERLTPRERDVLALLAQGEPNADIAGRLGMRESTVKAHVSRILTALEVTNRVQAALLARDAGLTP
ncbi:LuxR C-terminal-related transcriptional regulator [Streptomyces collinus]|uniref:LuxR C-terminal-related transcriptional regulator n=1 Tax=Streptomyces collinus TaxID=42684 RepID=UPI00364E5A52